MTWLVVTIFKLYFQDSNNQYVPHPTYPYFPPSNFVLGRNEGTAVAGSDWHYVPTTSPALAGRNHGAWDFINMSFLLNALGKVNSKAWQTGKTPPSFQNWTVRPSLNYGIQLPQSKPGWPHRGHIKAKHTCNLGTFTLQVLMGMWVGGERVIVPTSYFQVSPPPGTSRINCSPL